MKDFAHFIQALDQTTKTKVKVQAVADFFDHAQERDKVWVIALLSHKRPKRIISTTYLKEWTAEVAGIPDWLFDESYQVVGDLAETISHLVYQEYEVEKTLSEWINWLESLRKEDPHVIKTKAIEAWKGLSSFERFIFNKLITGGFRIGVSQKIMTKGLAQSTGIDENELAHRLMGDWDPFNITFNDLVLEDSKGSFADARPYPFFLAYPVENPEKELADLSKWIAEFKWDGIRGQIIKRNGLVSIWSRGEELVTEKFPELVAMAENLPDGIALDGEIIPWKEGKVLDFQVMQTRIGRKSISKKLLEDAPIHFMAYDLLEFEKKDRRESPLTERKKVLKEVVADLNHSNLLLSEVLEGDSLEQIEELKEAARQEGAEGLMLKRKDSEYAVGRKKGGWYKWKVDPYTIDAVLTYAMRGHGRRANLYTDYTFGLWRDEELVTFAKAYSGLTDAEFKEVDRFIKKNIIDKFGPVKQVKAVLVFELAFEGISLSKRHKSGVAVRFPRIHRWRKDKKPEEANTIEDLMKLKL